MKPELTFKIAENSIERAQALEIMNQVFVEELNYTNIKPDQFDQVADFLIAIKDNHIVASLRVVPDSPLGLPIESFINLSDLRGSHAKIAEISRFACLKEHRKSNLTRLGSDFFYQTVKSLGYTHLVLESLLKTERLYRSLGFIPIGEPFYDKSVDLGTHHKPNSVALLKTLEGNLGEQSTKSQRSCLC